MAAVLCCTPRRTDTLANGSQHRNKDKASLFIRMVVSFSSLTHLLLFSFLFPFFIGFIFIFIIL